MIWVLSKIITQTTKFATDDYSHYVRIVGRKPIDYEGPLVQLLLQVTRVDHLPTTKKSEWCLGPTP